MPDPLIAVLGQCLADGQHKHDPIRDLPHFRLHLDVAVLWRLLKFINLIPESIIGGLEWRKAGVLGGGSPIKRRKKNGQSNAAVVA